MKLRWLISLLAAWLGAVLGTAPAAEALPLRTSIRQVRELSREEAARGYPVRVRGVLTFYEPIWFLSFVQDQTGGVYFSAQEPGLQAGMEVEIEGISAPGQMTPIVIGAAGKAVQVRTVGSAAWPQPIPMATALLPGDAYDAQWVSLRGKVTAVNRLNDGVMVDFLTAGVPVRAAIPHWPQDWSPPGYLRGLEIEARGVYGPPKARQYVATTPVLYTPSLETITIAPESLSELFNRPRQTFESLFQFDWITDPGLVRIFGQVESVVPGAGFFISLSEGPGTGGKLWIGTSAPDKLSPGDLVDVVGWRQFFDREPVLNDALFRVQGRQTPPPRRPVTARELQADPGAIGAHGLQISVEAALVEQQSSLTEDSLVLEDQGSVFLARFRHNGSTRLPRLGHGTRLRLGGICIVKRMPNLGNLPPGFAFQVLLSSPTDVAVLRRPPWWTGRRILWLCGVVALLGLLVAGWAALLRRQVARQSAVIRGQVQREAVAQERTRIARELHDSLGQGLVGVALQLDSAAARLFKSPQEAERALTTARIMVRHSQAEAKRSVADLRAEELDREDLPAALADLLQPVVPANGPTHLEIQVQGKPRRLEGIIEHHLLRIGQEAVANAARHARASRILVRLEYEARRVALEVKDDGCGFDANEATAVASGHFGLLGLRERVNKLQGRLRIESQTGTGTLVAVTIPLDDPNTA